MRVLALVMFAVMPSFACGQAPLAVTSEFAVATIKPSAAETASLTQIRGNRFVSQGNTLVDVFKYAYSVHSSQIAGGPEWIRTERFDILADPETEKRPTSDEMKALVQRLLIDRFNIVMHQEQRVLPVYALMKLDGTTKLTPTKVEAVGIPVVAFMPRGELDVGNATMANFATFLQRFAVDRPVVDRTNTEGRFDLTLRWTPDNFRASGTVTDAAVGPMEPPGLFTAIREQLGMKLEATKAATSVFVIDSVGQPLAN